MYYANIAVVFRRKLTVCPILEGEDQLRLLNYQHNAITRIQHLSTLRRLIFLDLYDNQIDQIAGLAALKSLRVLMLGKNKWVDWLITFCRVLCSVLEQILYVFSALWAILLFP